MPVDVVGALQAGHALEVYLAGGAHVGEVQVDIVARNLAVVLEAVLPLRRQPQVVTVRVVLTPAFRGCVRAVGRACAYICRVSFMPEAARCETN